MIRSLLTSANFALVLRVIKANLITQMKNIDGIDSVNIEFVGQANEDYHRDGALLSATQKNVLQTTYAASSSSVNVSAENYRNIVTAQQTQNAISPNSSTSPSNLDLTKSIVSDGSTSSTSLSSVGSSTIVAYQNTSQYDAKKLVGIDPVLGDIVIGQNELIVLRGGWTNRNGVFFSEDPKTTTGFSTINIIWKGVTPRT